MLKTMALMAEDLFDDNILDEPDDLERIVKGNSANEAVFENDGLYNEGR